MEKDLNKVEYPDTNLPKQNRGETLFGMFQTTDVIPTNVPIKMIDQIVIYSSGATYKLYVFDTTSKAWKSVVIA